MGGGVQPLSLNLNPINMYEHGGWHSCPKHNLCRALTDDLIDNDEKVALYKKYNKFKTSVQKPCVTIFMSKMAKIDILLMIKTAEKIPT